MTTPTLDTIADMKKLNNQSGLSVSSMITLAIPSKYCI